MFKAKTKFLIVDDFSNMRKIIKKVIGDMGYENTVEAADGQTAYELLVMHAKAGEPFEFIIADWNMPNMSGLELLKKCRNEDRFKTLPFMMVTAEADEKHILEALRVGVTEYVVKPFTPAKLKEKLESSYKKIKTAKAKAA